MIAALTESSSSHEHLYVLPIAVWWMLHSSGLRPAVSVASSSQDQSTFSERRRASDASSVRLVVETWHCPGSGWASQCCVASSTLAKGSQCVYSHGNAGGGGKGGGDGGGVGGGCGGEGGVGGALGGGEGGGGDGGGGEGGGEGGGGRGGGDGTESRHANQFIGCTVAPPSSIAGETETSLQIHVSMLAELPLQAAWPPVAM